MSNLVNLTEARKNLGELVNQAFYEGKLFSIAKGNKPMGAFVGAREWKAIIRVVETHDPGLADTLALMADPELELLLKEDDENIKNGTLIPWEQVQAENASP